jgi:hypothetical protein
MGVVGALLMLIRVGGNPLRHFIDLRMDERVNAAGVDVAGQVISIVLFVALCAYLYMNSKRAKVSDS